jgi:hypothetical protein
MGGNTSSEQLPVASPLLTPIDTSTLKQPWLREKKTDGQPESLKAFVDQFLKEDGRRYNCNLLIWTSENSFVRVDNQRIEGFPGACTNRKFFLRLTSSSHILSLCIHSSNFEDAMSCIDFLVGLRDDHYKQMFIICNIPDREEGPPICPLTSVLLEKMLQQNAKRKNSFFCTTFTPDQSRTLATSGTRTDIELNRCKFQDDGEAFLEALAAREDPETGLAKLTIQKSLPFAEGILVLHQHQLESLTLNHMFLESEEACRAVAEAEVQYLELDNCRLSDGGASLVESIREGRGPKGLGVTKSGSGPFDSSERFASFLDALRNNSNLERLDLSRFDFREDAILGGLAAALFENKGLFHLGLPGCRWLNTSCFCKVLRAISTHPSLCTVDLAYTSIDMDATEATKAVAEMLSVNEQLEEIRIEDRIRYSFDSSVRVKLVIPRLEYNIYRKRFRAVQEIRVPSTRAAVLASALAHVSSKPSPVFMLFRENVDILSIYLMDK